jgi:hypothetical protein
VALTCDLCGGGVDDDVPPLTWSVSMERGRVRRYCEGCTRDNLRAMDGKLDAEYW